MKPPREEALRETLEYPDGTTACEYIRRNEAVVSIQYTPKEHSLLPITVYTYDDLAAAEQAVTVRHILFSIVYCVEVGAALLLYRGKVIAMPAKEDIDFEIAENLIVELYSK